ncbi:MAG: glycerophosphodiester phosphodiesterase family protein [Arachidicoccus sp.]|nr:glycerophosphodiester phosphodiesterase family protein [Arachidicoccus sp.]
MAHFKYESISMKDMKLSITIAACFAAMSIFGQAGKSRTSATILRHFLHPSSNYILVGAHRGDWRDAPENSMNVLQGTLKMGADIMETDVRKTKDGVLVLMHDPTINRTTTGQGSVSNLTWEYLKNVTLREGDGGPTEQHIPMLKDFMLAVKNKPILINLDKSWDIIAEVYAVLKETGTVDQAILKGSLPLPELRKKYGSIIDSIHYMPMISSDNYKNDSDSEAYGTNYISGYFNDYRPAGFELQINKESSPVLTQAAPQVTARKVTLWINSLWADLCAGHDDERSLTDPDANWGWLIKKGANALLTDHPKEMLEYLRRKKLHD